MDNRNETALRQCRFLNDGYFQQLYNAFIEAFSDYVVPFALTETQFRNHIILNGVELDRTAGCLEGDRLVGFSMNGFGQWDGLSTVYDAGTGVVPDCRRQGVSEAMFEMMMPVFVAGGIRQCLLEVVTNNIAAIRLYEKLGFHTVRELALLQCDTGLRTDTETPPEIDVRNINDPDWDLMTTFWDGQPSWQNSVDAVTRSRKVKQILGAFINDRLVGYIIFSSIFGRVAQLAVEKGARRRGVASALVQGMRSKTADGFSLQVINIDKSLASAMEFFKKIGFYERLSQFEMTKPLAAI